MSSPVIPYPRPRSGRRVLRAVCLGILLCAGPAWAADLAALEERLRVIEDGEGTTPEAVIAELKALEPLLPAEDAALGRRFRRVWCWNGFPAQAAANIAYAEAQAAEAKQAGDVSAEADFILCRGYVRNTLNQTDKALADYGAAARMAEQIGDRRLAADAHSLRGSLASMRGELAQALLDLQAAQRHYESLGLKSWSRQNLSEIANAYRRLGDLDKSLEYYKQLRRSFQDDKDALGESGIINLSGHVLFDMARYEEALATYRQAAELARQAGLTPEDATDHLSIASVLVLLGRPEEALEELELARANAQKNEDSLGLAMVELYRGQALSRMGQHEQALGHFALAEPQFRDSEQSRFLGWLHKSRRDTLAAMGRWQAAYEEGLSYYATHEKLDSLLRERESSRLRVEFDTERKETENRQLQLERDLKERELSALDQARRWQWGVIALATILLVILVALAVRQIRKARRLHALAMTDELTQIANRRHIELVGAEAIRKSREDKRPMSILVFDVDYFKRTNDSHGHGVGDQVLVRVAKASQAALRQNDRLGRTGGEEFLVVLPNTSLMQAVQVAERLRAGVAATSMRDLAEGLHSTISIGVAELKPADADLRAFTMRADNALYRAKGNGRNRVEFES
ncbi:MAG: diguanylate cyclase [Gammaproteobacteria bacterium]|nr:diguanylate cyclase [Gammaproteobacteria bacterium]